MTQPVLALETSTPVCSVALYDGTQFRERRAQGPGIHAEKAFVFIEELLAESRLSMLQLSALLVSSGPGSYTGLRIASSAAKGLLFGILVPLMAVETLPGIARAALGGTADKPRRIHAVINARRTHLYHQSFSVLGGSGRLQANSSAALLSLSDIRASLQPGDLIAGTGTGRLQPELPGGLRIIGPEQALSAVSLIRLHQEYGEVFSHKTDIESFEPLYQPG